MRYRLLFSPTYWRRRRCMKRGHPMAEWSPWVGPIQYGEDGTMYGARSWRCSLHDRPPA